MSFFFFFFFFLKQSKAGIISVRLSLSSLSGRLFSSKLGMQLGKGCHSLVSRGQFVSGVSWVRTSHITTKARFQKTSQLPPPLPFRPHLTPLLPFNSQHGRWGFWILSSGFRFPSTGFQSLPVELRFWITIVSGIPVSLNCIPDSEAQDSELHKQNVPGFRIPQAKNSRILESRFPYMGYEGGGELVRRPYSTVLLFVCFFVFFPSMLHLTKCLVFAQGLSLKIMHSDTL